MNHVAPWVAVLSVLASFTLGSVSPATFVARARGADIARQGSRNPGATNVGRVVGRGWGVVVGVLDLLKGLVPTLLAVHYGSLHLAYAVGFAAILGHVYSPFLRGRGGKGVATTFGALLGAHWPIALLVLGVFLVVLLGWHWVAAGSIAGAGMLIVLGLVGLTGHGVGDGWTGLWELAIGVLVAERHVHQIESLLRIRRL